MQWLTHATAHTSLTLRVIEAGAKGEIGQSGAKGEPGVVGADGKDGGKGDKGMDGQDGAVGKSDRIYQLYVAVFFDWANVRRSYGHNV